MPCNHNKSFKSLPPALRSPLLNVSPTPPLTLPLFPPHSASPPSIPTLLYPAFITLSPPRRSSSQPTSPATTTFFTILHIHHPPHPQHHHVSLANNLSSIPLDHRCLFLPCA